MLALFTVAMVPLYVGKNDVTLALPYPGTATLSTYPFIPTLDDVILLLSETYTLTSSLIESAISPSVSNTPGAVPINVAILADTALRAGDMDEAAAIEAQKQAEQAINNQTGDFDYASAATQLAEAVAQLRTIQQIRKKLGK